MPGKKRSSLRNLLEFLPAWLLLKILGVLPRRLAISIGRATGRIVCLLHRKLVRTGHRNLEMALPEYSRDQRTRIVKAVFDSLGRLLGEFSQFPKLNRTNIGELVVYDGLENYQTAAASGRGVLLLTGHFGSWELCAFAHGAFGHPLSFLVRPLDNPLLNKLINEYRCMSGNRVIDKNSAVRPVIETLRRGENVGLLIDANTMAGEGVFCDLFGIPACSTTGLAVFALRTEAPVVPGFLIWDAKSGMHKLRFDREVPLIRTGDFKEEVQLNTAQFAKIIEQYVRRYPDQWLWIHRRWKTRPEGSPDLYVSGTPATDADAALKMKVEA